jgi:hypothetical protein
MPTPGSAGNARGGASRLGDFRLMAMSLERPSSGTMPPPAPAQLPAPTLSLDPSCLFAISLELPMPRLSLRRAAPVFLVGLVTLLAGCGLKRDEFPPTCPRADLVWEAADIARYRQGVAAGTEDVRDLVLSGRIAAIRAKCQQGDNVGQLSADVSVEIQFNRGPAMQGREAVVPFFVAVTEGDRILDKHLYQVRVVFQTNTDQMLWGSDPIHMVFPVSATKSGAAYTILASFQLTPEELEATRRHAAAHP